MEENNVEPQVEKPVETPVETPVEEAPKETPKEEKANSKVRINPNKPLSSQVERLLEAVPEDKPEEKEEPKEEAKVEPVEEIPEDVELEEIPEETKQEPLPEWQKYIMDNLPEIQVIGHQGENGKDKVFKVKRLEDLPDDFEFTSKREELAFTTALASQEVNARELLQRYRGEESQRQAKEFEALEALDVQSDTKRLQDSGVLPKFKYPPNDPRFDTDPAVIEANKIYDFYEKINQEYYDKYNNSGRMYRVSYEDAAYRYYALHPKEAPKEAKEAPKETPPKKSAEQVEREKVASKIGSQGASSDGKIRPLMPGTSVNKVYQLYKRGVI